MHAEYEVHAIRYATREARRAAHFIGGDPHDAPMPMDYYLWLIQGQGEAIVVDTGFTETMAQQRRRTWLRCPVEALQHLDVQPQQVQDVIVTHLHYDHAGNLSRFPVAQFHLQEAEMRYATGKYMCFHGLRHGFEADDVVQMVRLLYADQVRFHDGEAQLREGITLHRVGGHTDGLQCVRVRTRRGWIVLASDASHFYENYHSRRPFTTAFHVGHMLEAFATLRRLADSEDHIIPGHDPRVMHLYPPSREGLAGIAASLHEAPRERSNGR